MRSGIIIPVVLAALVVIAVAVVFSAKTARPDEFAANQSIASNGPALVASSPPSYPAAVPQSRSAPGIVLAPKPAPSEEQIEAQNDVVEERISELNEMAASDDPNNLRQILAELDNSEPRIRAAAVEAAVQFKSPDAIPALQASFDRASDLDEKLRIRNAIEFLTPPVAVSDQ